MNNNKAYFNEIAPRAIAYRQKFNYYWDSITKHCNYFIQEDDTVLEIGCGVGNLIATVKGQEKLGIDFSEKMIEQAKKQFPNQEFLCVDAQNLQLEKKYDVVILSNLVGYLDDIQNCFLELHKVCHSQTKIIVSYYNFVWEPCFKFFEYIKLKKKAPYQNWMSRKDIQNLLYLAGFETFRQNRNMLLPINIPLLSVLMNKFISRLPIFNSLALNQYVFARPNPNLFEKKEYNVSVVIPARNESGNIENAITRMPVFGKSVEIIFIEGNSTDDTWDTICKVQQKYKDTHTIKIARQAGKGKADAVRKGYDIATGDILMILDADLTMPPEELPKFYNALAEGKGEFINGSRLVYPMQKHAMRFLNMLGNKFFSMLFSWLLDQPIKDTLCGTKVMFKKDYIRLTKNRSFFGDFDPFGDFDLLFGAYKLNLKIIDLPIHYAERMYGDTNISRFKHGVVLLKMCAYASLKIKFF